jgi:hypothetical protein
MARRHSSLTKERRTSNGLASHARTRTTSVLGLAFRAAIAPRASFGFR